MSSRHTIAALAYIFAAGTFALLATGCSIPDLWSVVIAASLCGVMVGFESICDAIKESKK